MATRQGSDALCRTEAEAGGVETMISEALASGTPVVATGVGGIPEMLDDLTGIIVPPQDEAALADAVCEVITGGKKFNEEAMRKAGEAYSFGNVGRQLVGIYEETIAK